MEVVLSVEYPNAKRVGARCARASRRRCGGESALSSIIWERSFLNARRTASLNIIRAEGAHPLNNLV